MPESPASPSDPGARAWDCVRATNILHSFATAVDAQDMEATLACFRADAELVTPQFTASGVQEIQNFFSGAWRRDPSEKRHFVSTPRVTWLEPGRVRLEAYFYFVGRMPEQSIVGWGEYDDIVDVTDDEPRFVRIAMQSHLRTDLVVGWAQQD